MRLCCQDMGTGIGYDMLDTWIPKKTQGYGSIFFSNLVTIVTIYEITDQNC